MSRQRSAKRVPKPSQKEHSAVDRHACIGLRGSQNLKVYYFMLYCIILYYFILYYIILYYMIIQNFQLFFNVFRTSGGLLFGLLFGYGFWPAFWIRIQKAGQKPTHQ